MTNTLYKFSHNSFVSIKQMPSDGEYTDCAQNGNYNVIIIKKSLVNSLFVII